MIFWIAIGITILVFLILYHNIRLFDTIYVDEDGVEYKVIEKHLYYITLSSKYDDPFDIYTIDFLRNYKIKDED